MVGCIDGIRLEVIDRDDGGSDDRIVKSGGDVGGVIEGV